MGQAVDAAEWNVRVGITEKNPLPTRPHELTHRSDQQQRGERDGDYQPCLSVEEKFRSDVFIKC